MPNYQDSEKSVDRRSATDIHGYILPYFMIDKRIQDASKIIEYDRSQRLNQQN